VGASYASCTSEIASALSRNEAAPGSSPGVGLLSICREFAAAVLPLGGPRRPFGVHAFLCVGERVKQ
jgi:hypothetical protein